MDRRSYLPLDESDKPQTGQIAGGKVAPPPNVQLRFHAQSNVLTGRLRMLVITTLPSDQVRDSLV